MRKPVLYFIFIAIAGTLIIAQPLFGQRDTLRRITKVSEYGKGKWFKVFHQEKGFFEVKGEGFFAHHNMRRFQEGIFTETHGEFEFPVEGEFFLDLYGDTLYTLLHDWENDRQILKRYRLDKGGWVLDLNKVINHALVEVGLLGKRGQFYVLDEIEGFGTVLEVFSANGESLLSYYPSPTGFFKGRGATLGDTSFFIFHPIEPDSSAKSVLIENSTGSVIVEKRLDFNIREFEVTHAYGIGKQFLIHGSTPEGSQRRIDGYSKIGSYLWSLPIILPYSHRDFCLSYDQSNQSIFAITNWYGLTRISTEGNILWEIDLGEEYQKRKGLVINPHKNLHVITSFQEEGSCWIMMGTGYYATDDINSYSFKNNLLFHIDSSGQITNSYGIDSHFGYNTVYLRKPDNHLIILSENKTQIIK